MHFLINKHAISRSLANKESFHSHADSLLSHAPDQHTNSLARHPSHTYLKANLAKARVLRVRQSLHGDRTAIIPPSLPQNGGGDVVIYDRETEWRAGKDES